MNAMIHAAATKAAVKVEPVTSRRDREMFVRLPWSIYRFDGQWVPPLLIERREFINPRKHPFYLHGEARQFLAWRGDVLAGRISVSDDPHFNETHGTNTGCFGLFECFDDEEVATALLDTAAGWLRDRGRDQMLGPIDYSTNYTCGLLVEGFDWPPRVMMNHNPPYYARLLESYGLRKAKDLLSWWFTDPDNMLEKWRTRAERLTKRGGVSVRPFDVNNFERDLRYCQEIYNEAWRDNWGFIRMTDAEVRYLAQQLKHLAVPEMLLLAEVDGKPVGFSMTLPDFNEAMRPLNGRLFPWGLPIGLFRFMRNQRRIKTGRLLTLGIRPEFRRRGITEMLILRTLDYGIHALGYTGAELGWTLEDNRMIISAIEAVGAQRYKRYRIYEKQIG